MRVAGGWWLGPEPTGRESWGAPQPPLGTTWDSTASSVKGARDNPLGWLCLGAGCLNTRGLLARRRGMGSLRRRC